MDKVAAGKNRAPPRQHNKFIIYLRPYVGHLKVIIYREHAVYILAVYRLR